eukprot:1007740-Lingulodinium_polyedra.AAC.1
MERWRRAGGGERLTQNRCASAKGHRRIGHNVGARTRNVGGRALCGGGRGARGRRGAQGGP